MESQYLACLVASVSGVAIFLLRPRPKLASSLSVIVSVGLLVASGVIHWNTTQDLFLSVLIALLAVACLLAQRTTKDSGVSIALTLLFEGFLFPFINGGPAAKIAEALLLALLSFACFRFRKNNALGLGAAVAFTVALVAFAISSVMPSMAVLTLITAAALLPLFPLHVGYVGALNNLPGTLPAFLALALPLVGLRTLGAVATVPHELGGLIVALAVIGALVTSIRSFVQTNLSRIISAIGVLSLSPAWWLFVSAGKLAPEVVAYVVAVLLAISGLRLCAHCVESRYGTEALESVPGLATTMPRFGVSVMLLVMASLGMPALAGFSTFSLLLHDSLALSFSDVIYVCTVWFVCFVIQLSVMQRLLFNQPRANLIYTDLTRTEVMSIAVIILLLIVGGLSPGLMLGLAS